LAICQAASAGAAEAERYNIISIVTDDQALWTLGAYGNREVRTPHLDRLAAASRFASRDACSGLDLRRLET